MAKRLVIAYLHTHWDREWYRTYEEFTLRLLEVFDEALNELETGAMPMFYFDGQTSALMDYLKFRPEKLELVKKLIAEKRLFVGPFTISADSFLVNAISLIKNLESGLKYSKSLGVTDFIGYLSDTFGHSKGIFEILKSFNIEYALLWRGVGAIPADFTSNGLKVSRLVQGYFMDALHGEKSFEQRALAVEGILDKIAARSSDTLLLPIGADHLAVLKDSKNVINEVNKHLKNYEIKLSSPFEYFESVDFSGFKLDGEFLDNSETYILPGVYSSRTAQKAYNARLQHNLFKIIEPMNIFLDGNYGVNLDYAANELIKNHAHDSIYGCSLDEVHRHVETRFDTVNEIVDGIKHRLIRDFKRKNSSNRSCVAQNAACGNDKIGVFNFSNSNFSGVTRVLTDKKLSNAQLIGESMGFKDEILYDTRQIPITEDFCPLYEYLIEAKDLQPLSFTALNCVEPLNQLTIDENLISNSRLELSIERFNSEKIINLKDKLTGKCLKNAFNILVTEDFGDSYNYAPSKNILQYKLLDTIVLEKGPIRAILRLVFENEFLIDVSLNNFSEIFEFGAKFNNSLKNVKIQACFNLESPIESTIAEDTIGCIERKHDYNYLLADEMPAKPKLELKTNSYPMQRFVVAQDSGVITEGLNEYEIYKNHLKIALLRATGKISTPKNAARYVPAGPPLDTPELQAQGEQNFRFAFAFNSDIKGFFRLSDVFYDSTIAFLGEFKYDFKKFLEVDNKNIIFYGIKSSENKHFGVFYNIDTNSHTILGREIAPKTLEYIEIG